MATTRPFRFLGCCFAMSLLGPNWPAGQTASEDPTRWAPRSRAARGTARRHRMRPMRAVQIVELSGPSSLKLADDLPEPGPSHMLAPDGGVVVDVKAAGVSFPEVL